MNNKNLTLSSQKLTSVFLNQFLLSVSLLVVLLTFSNRTIAQTILQTSKVITTSICIDESLIDLNASVPSIYAPVCGCDGVTYDNEYVAQTYHGVTDWTNGPCGCELELQTMIGDPVCYGNLACFLAEGGTAPFTFFVNSNTGITTTQDAELCLENVAAGTYEIGVTDAAGCTAYTTYTVVEANPLAAEFEFKGNICDDQVGGCLTVSGGSMPYNVHVFKLLQFDGTIPAVVVNANNQPTVDNAEVANDVNFDGTTTPNEWKRCAENIQPGHYLVVVVDANGCHIKRHIFIPEANPLTTDFIVTNEDCSGTDGCLIIEGGEKPYRVFVFTRNDNNGSTDLPTPNIAADGTVTVDEMQATAAIDVAPITPDGFYGNEICAEEIPVGVYYVLVLDANNCWAFEKVIIEPTNDLNAEFEFMGNACDDQVGGCLTVSGGSLPYNVHVFRLLQFDGTIPAVVVNANNQPTVDNAELANDVNFDGTTTPNEWKRCAENIQPGHYLVVVVDANGCHTRLHIFIPEVNYLNVEFELKGNECDEKVGGCLTITGGAMPYNVHIFKRLQNDSTNVPMIEVNSNNIPAVADTERRDDIAFITNGANAYKRCAEDIEAGHYIVVVVDANGCYTWLHVFIPEANPLTTDFIVTNEDCSGTDGCLIIEGGEKPYRVFVFTRNDNNGSTDLPTPNIAADGTVTVDEMQTTAAVNVAPNTPDGFYGNEICAEEIPAGVYYILVLDANNCWSFERVVIESAAAIELNLNFDPYGAFACVDPVGGAAPYSVLFTNLETGAANQVAGEFCTYDLEPGIYTVEATDNNGCSEVEIFIIEENPCKAGQVILEPQEIESGENSTFYLIGWSGVEMQWQFRTTFTDWMNIPGANEDVYETPNIHVGSDKEIFVRAVVICENGEVLISDAAILYVFGNFNVQPITPAEVDRRLMDRTFMEERAKDIQKNEIVNEDIRDQQIDATVFPTSTNNDLKVNFDFTSNDKTIIRVVDFKGQVQLTKEVSEVTEDTIENLRVNGLPNGSYFLNIENNGRVISLQFFVEK